MNELELMIHAKKYIDKMANGIDPLTDQPVGENDLINNVRISRCLFYVSGVLNDVIARGIDQPKKPAVKKPSFSITAEELQAFPFSEQPIPITELVRRINMLKSDSGSKPLYFSAITGWLTNEGLLESQQNEFGKMTKRPTEAGRAVGIKTIERQGLNGNYTATVYDIEAQHYIIDNFDRILGN